MPWLGLVVQYTMAPAVNQKNGDVGELAVIGAMIQATPIATLAATRAISPRCTPTLGKSAQGEFH